MAAEGPFIFCAIATLHKYVSNCGQDPHKGAEIDPHSRRCMSAMGDPRRALGKSPSQRRPRWVKDAPLRAIGQLGAGYCQDCPRVEKPELKKAMCKGPAAGGNVAQDGLREEEEKGAHGCLSLTQETLSQ